MKQSVKAIQPSDAVLIEGIQQGNNKAMEKLMKRYGTAAQLFLHRRLHNTQRERDILQEAWIKAWSEIMLFRYTDEKYFWYWFKAILQSELVKNVRVENHFVHDDVVLENHPLVQSENDAIMKLEFEEEVDIMTADMQEPMRTIMRKRLKDGSLYREIAEDLGISISDVGVSFLRGKKKIEKKFLLSSAGRWIKKLFTRRRRKKNQEGV
jgi:RNA polymerase sigma-70 factor (ECF subfamily)